MFLRTPAIGASSDLRAKRAIGASSDLRAERLAGAMLREPPPPEVRFCV